LWLYLNILTMHGPTKVKFNSFLFKICCSTCCGYFNCVTGLTELLLNDIVYRTRLHNVIIRKIKTFVFTEPQKVKTFAIVACDSVWLCHRTNFVMRVEMESDWPPRARWKAASCHI
jgi:hypothetical protein